MKWETWQGAVPDTVQGLCENLHRETGRRYGAQEKEHNGDMNSLEEVKFTRYRKKDSLTEVHPSTLTDHVVQTNHIIDN